MLRLPIIILALACSAPAARAQMQAEPAQGRGGFSVVKPPAKPFAIAPVRQGGPPPTALAQPGAGYIEPADVEERPEEPDEDARPKKAAAQPAKAAPANPAAAPGTAAPQPAAQPAKPEKADPTDTYDTPPEKAEGDKEETEAAGSTNEPAADDPPQG